MNTPLTKSVKRVGSPPMKLAVTDWWEVIKQGLFIMVAALATWITNLIGDIDWGENTLLIMAVWRAVLELLARFGIDTEVEVRKFVRN